MKNLLLLVCSASLVSLFVCATVEASCCSSASTGGIGRLLAHERAMVEMASGMRYLYGSFDNNARLSFGHVPHLPHITVEPEVQVMTRLLDFFEPFVRIPLRIQKSERRTRARMADISLGARIPVFKENLLYGWPALTIFASVLMPTGTSSSAGRELTNEDITGMGQWVLSSGVFLEKEFYGITYGLGYSFAAGTDFFKGQLKGPGAIHSPLLTLNVPVHEHGSLSLSIAPVFHTAYRGIADSDRRKLSISTGYALNLHSHIKITAQIGSDVPFSYVGKNFSSEVFFRLGMRFGVY